MEYMGSMSEGEWNSLSGMCIEDADFMSQLLCNSSLTSEQPPGSNFAISSSFWLSHDPIVNIVDSDECTMYSLDETNASMCSFSQGSSYSGGSLFFPSSSPESYYHSESDQFFVCNDDLIPSGYCVIEGKSRGRLLTNHVMEGNDFLSQDVSNDSTDSNGNHLDAVLEGKNIHFGSRYRIPTQESSKEDELSNLPEICKKRPRIREEVQKNKRSVRAKQNQKFHTSDNDEDYSTFVLQRQNSSSCCSEDDSNASLEFNGGVTSNPNPKGPEAVNSNVKTRASRGSATDPQSLYARKRRERINERLRILQNLVPNGKKVDISTMLEEAVQYVKFLQLQIKLLSSDDLWMYAPLAYNGMEIGLDLKTATIPKPES